MPRIGLRCPVRIAAKEVHSFVARILADCKTARSAKAYTVDDLTSIARVFVTHVYWRVEEHLCSAYLKRAWLHFVLALRLA